MRVVLVLLAVLALGGCVDQVLGRAPVVLVEESFSFEGVGTAEAHPGWKCEMARLSEDRRRVELLRPEGSSRPGFVLLRETGDTWRAANRSSEPTFTLVGLASSGGGGSANGMPAVFRDGPQDMYEVRWDGRRAWLDGTPLARGEPVTRSWTYTVPTDEGGSVRVTETVRATYLGRLDVDVVPLEGLCALT